MEAQFGGKLGPISCFSKVLPFPSYGGGSVLATRVHFLSGTICMPLFSSHFSTPLVSESAPAGAALPSQSSHNGQKTGQSSTQMWWRESQRQAMVSHNTVWIVQFLEQPEVANTKVDAIVGMKEVMYNLLHQ